MPTSYCICQAYLRQEMLNCNSYLLILLEWTNPPSSLCGQTRSSGNDGSGRKKHSSHRVLFSAVSSFAVFGVPEWCWVLWARNLGTATLKRDQKISVPDAQWSPDGFPGQNHQPSADLIWEASKLPLINEVPTICGCWSHADKSRESSVTMGRLRHVHTLFHIP